MLVYIVFADGSEKAYGAVAYLRIEDVEENVRCSFVMSKARLTPMNNKTLKTIPRVELNAAKLAVILAGILQQELKMNLHGVYFWSDSTAVLKYIILRFNSFSKICCK